MLTASIKKKTYELGFELVGIARADDNALPVAVERYVQWLNAGHALTMGYLLRHQEKKSNPEKILPGLKSILCVGLLYGASPSEKNDAGDGSRAQVSQYTRGQDYHDLMSERLAKLATWLTEVHDIKSYPFVDSAPVFDRFWAWRAGLGWLGKNTMLINRKLGSYFFIGGLLLTTELVADVPDSDHCGRCRKCIDACPTGAITEFRFIESAKCIGYHTIENRGVVPESVAEHSGRWIAVCDICQNVCPWNDPVTPGSAFTTTHMAFDADLRDLARWNAAEFKDRMSGVAMGRMKFSGFVRNVIIAIANSDCSIQEKKDALACLEISAESDGARAALIWARSKILKGKT